MNMSGKVGAVKMQPLYALKRVAEEYSMSTVIGGGILKRFETIINEKVKEVKTQEQVVEEVPDNKATFGEDVLKDLLGDEIKINQIIMWKNKIFQMLKMKMKHIL